MRGGLAHSEKAGLLLGAKRVGPRFEGYRDVRLLADAVFSQRCYITRWAYLLELEGSGWIIGAIDRLGEFVNVIKG